jgi:hypothetical protein
MNRRWLHSTFLISTVLVLTAHSAPAQAQDRAYVGGGFGLITQNSAGDSRTSATGIGKTSDGALVVGVHVSRRVAIEVEPSWSGSAEQQVYSLNPSPSTTVKVASSQRTTFVTFGVRTRIGVLEPVVGFSYVGRTITRRGTDQNGRPYYDDEQSSGGMALAGGVDLGSKPRRTSTLCRASGCSSVPTAATPMGSTVPHGSSTSAWE